MANLNYRTTRKYKCPYCDYRSTRSELVDHVDDMHSDLLPEGYTAARAVYDFINGKNYGICMICKSKVYDWNDKISRYYNLCKNPACKAKVRERALSNHIKVHNKPTLLNDPEQQEKMLANRKISGTYTFTDGGKVTYTGSYEKKALEFIDKVLEIPSKDIQAPGPVLEYEFEGTKHLWITDIYYIPGNLLIEVKDGGSNPNNRSMDSYRAKQVAKETMVTDIGIFNYIRLTNNDFAQLLAVFADMKNKALLEENPKATIHINEEVGGLPLHRPPEAYIVPYGMNNVFDGFAYSDSEDDMVIYPTDEGYAMMHPTEFEKTFNTGPRMYYTGTDIKERISIVRENIKNNSATKSGAISLAEYLIGRTMASYKDVFLCESFRYYSRSLENMIVQMRENAITVGVENLAFQDKNVVEVVDSVFICRSDKGIYATTPQDFYMASSYYTDIEDLKNSGVIKLMNDFYRSNHIRNGGGH